MDHINNGPYQLLKKDATTRIKAKTLKNQLKALKEKEFIDNKFYYYFKPTDPPLPIFHGQPTKSIQDRSSYMSYCFI